ncbi:MAG: shikimate dehydrogenase [Pelagibacteraceae bacterium]|nr:shikimate dehydrogenase [Pelagibacteraceae bacterium]|tara:strand:+ start:1212 stop:2057 length:846 start_codon:yes stop_codon:yes gene_type:complete
MYKIAILGYPIKHSLSPKIHNYWLKEMKINGKYTAIKTPIKNLEKTIKNLSNKGYKGLNLTIPLKEEVLKYINSKNKIVDIIGAANVLIFSKKGHVKGKNTDVYGFKKSILKLVKNKRKEIAIVIGSGGAARAIVYVLIQMNYKKIIIYNRTKKNAEIIKKDLLKKHSSKLQTKINCENLKKIKNNIKKTNLLINTTPMGMKNFPNLNIDIKDLRRDAAVFDLIYNPLETKLIKESNKRGIKNTNGLDMLIYQAQKSFFYWLNKTPKITEKLKKILEKEIK